MATHSIILAWRIPMDRGTWQVHEVGESDTSEKVSTAYIKSQLKTLQNKKKKFYVQMHNDKIGL